MLVFGAPQRDSYDRKVCVSLHASILSLLFALFQIYVSICIWEGNSFCQEYSWIQNTSWQHGKYTYKNTNLLYFSNESNNSLIFKLYFYVNNYGNTLLILKWYLNLLWSWSFKEECISSFWEFIFTALHCPFLTNLLWRNT